LENYGFRFGSHFLGISRREERSSDLSERSVSGDLVSIDFLGLKMVSERILCNEKLMDSQPSNFQARAYKERACRVEKK
jgi:hypothetical protein